MASVIPQASHPEKVVSNVPVHTFSHVHAYHRVHELNAIVLRWVVTRSDHATDGLAIELA